MTIDEIVEEHNKRCPEDEEILQCEFCKTYSMWGGYQDDATLWFCDKCNKVFCEKRSKVNTEEDEKVLCPDCKGSETQ